MIANNGATEFFEDGSPTVGGTARKIKFIKIIEATTFTSIFFDFPASAGATPPMGTVFPPLYELWDVKTFAIATGRVQVFYKN